MIPAGALTWDDLDNIEFAAFQSDDPLAGAAELAEAAEQCRLADPANTGYAFGYQHAFHAQLLLELGHEDEGMAILSALRPAMATDLDAGITSASHSSSAVTPKSRSAG